MIQPLDDFHDTLVVGPDFNANRALPHARQHHVQIQNRRQQAVRHGVAGERAVGLDGKIQPRDAGQRQHGRVQLAAFGHLLHPRDDVAANLDHFQIRPRGEQLLLAPRAAGGNRRAFRKILQLHSRLEAAQIILARRPIVGFFRRALLQKFRVAINQNVADIFALRRGGENQSRRNFRRQILQAVDGEAGVAF